MSISSIQRTAFASTRGVLFSSTSHQHSHLRDADPHARRHAANFLLALVVETIDITTKITGRTQVLLEQADTALLRMCNRKEHGGAGAASRQRGKIASQPANTRDGLQQAYERCVLRFGCSVLLKNES